MANHLSRALAAHSSYLLLEIAGCASARDVGLHNEGKLLETIRIASQGGVGLTIALCIAIICATIVFIKLLSHIH